jgi:aminomethyltransferase
LRRVGRRRRRPDRYLKGDDEVFVVPNAANTAEVMGRLAASAPSELTVRDLHRDYAVLAVQGPRSAALVGALGLPTALGYMSYAVAEWGDGHVVVCRTGYTGEVGFELIPRSPAAPALWDALLDAGSAYGALPCGLGARDTLRTEMGYPLHGTSSRSTSRRCRRGAVGGRLGQAAVLGPRRAAAREGAGAGRLLWGLLAQDRGIPRAGMVQRPGRGTQPGLGRPGRPFSPTPAGRNRASRSCSGHPRVGDEVTVVRARPASRR